MNVQMPDGTIIEGVPEGTTRAQILERYRKGVPRVSLEDRAMIDDFRKGSVLDQFLAGAGKSFADIGRGVKQMSGNMSRVEADEAKRLDAPLMNTSAGFAGNVTGSLAAALPAAFVPGLNTAVGAGALGGALGALQPVGENDSRLLNTAIGVGAGGLSQAAVNNVGQAFANRSAAKAAELASARAQNAVRDSTVKAAQDAGFSLPPAQVSPTAINRALEGFAGKLTTAQQAASKNQSVTNRLVRADLGLPADVPLVPETMRAIRTEAAQKGYAPLAGFGEIRADKQYAERMMELATKYDKGHGGMASLRNPDVEGIIADASKMSFESDNVIVFLRNLREQGFANRAPMNNAKTRALGQAQIDIAHAIEDLTERSLSNAGQAEVLQNFREARRLIAKAFTAEKAINPATGNIDAGKLGTMFKKGKPLDAGMREVGRVNAAFPAATKEITTSLPGLSPLDYVGGMLTGSAAGPAGLAATFSRPMVRSAILSGPYQRSMVNPPSYELGLLRKKLPDLLDSPFAGLLGASQVPTFLGRPE